MTNNKQPQTMTNIKQQETTNNNKTTKNSKRQTTNNNNRQTMPLTSWDRESESRINSRTFLGQFVFVSGPYKMSSSLEIQTIHGSEQYILTSCSHSAARRPETRLLLGVLAPNLVPRIPYFVRASSVSTDVCVSGGLQKQWEMYG